RAGRPGRLPASAAVRHSPVRGIDLRAHHLPDLRAGQPRQLRGRLRGGVHLRRDHRAGRALLRPRVGLRAGLCVLHRDDVHPPAGAHGAPVVSRALPWMAGALLIALPFVYRSPYPLHILVIILIWSFAYTSWSVMGRFGLTSLGHGGFMGVGAYVTALLWN